MQARIPPPVLALLAALAMVGLARTMPVAHLIQGDLRWLGAFVAVLAAAMMVSAALQFRRAKTTTNPMQPESAAALVTTGVFAFSRNPMYLGLLLILGGVAIWLGALTPWLVLPLFAMALTALQIRAEERALERLFGVEYQAYRRTTDRWFGRFSRPGSR